MKRLVLILALLCPAAYAQNPVRSAMKKWLALALLMAGCKAPTPAMPPTAPTINVAPQQQQAQPTGENR